jgi:hypothetical protein
VVVNIGTGGNGNFSSDGLPGISNLIILNGADQTDSFFNDSTTGASTLSIGSDEIAQASVVQNGYSTEWGRQAGAVETYATALAEACRLAGDKETEALAIRIQEQERATADEVWEQIGPAAGRAMEAARTDAVA